MDVGEGVMRGMDTCTEGEIGVGGDLMLSIGN
jgi:hypothetical protein